MINRKLRIILDMDDVLEDLLGGWLDWINKTYGINTTKKDIIDWSMHGCLKEYIDNGTIEKESDVYKPLYLNDFWKTLSPLPGAVESVRELNNRHEVYIATASHYKTVESKLENCLFKYFDFLDMNQVIIIHNKSLLRGDIIVDDRYENVAEFIKENPTAIGILVDAPYNREYLTEGRMYRASNWSDIMSLINEYSEFYMN